ncbi:pseudouridine synthase [Lipomyces orientalis]|uniref:Pseudouridine synthase n=1 Tax=Lipomyces orientalis TaxID=1233043 RepID=A0ACC3THN9_9ASCO
MDDTRQQTLTPISFFASHVRQYDSGGFRVRRQVLDARQSTLADVLGETRGAAEDQSFKVVTIHDEVAQGAKYVMAEGLRKVPPYYFTYLTYCKQRWRDRNILDIFVTEFRDRDEEYYKLALASGLVTINTKLAGLETIVRNGDRISHRIHRHEPPVPAKSIEIVFQDEDIIAIDKPSGIPVHPTGRYRFNTITEIMKHEMGLVVHPCHRLDRLTSGIMFLARTAKAAQLMGGRLRERTVFKEYVARVLGEFPAEEVTCDMPVITVHPKLGLNRVKMDGKPATTIFNRLSYNGETSVVRCRPLTGRTHQIRVHLQYLGHPIGNDPIYANRRVFGPDLGKGGSGDDDDIVGKLARMGKYEEAQSVAYEEIIQSSKKANGEKLSGEECDVCGTELYSDPGLNDLELWLHAQRYGSRVEGWEYETNLPEWAIEDLGM